MDARWRRGWLEVDNGDLWAELDELLRGRVGDSVRFVKVKGHANMADVRKGIVRLEDKRGNDAADVLARRGASLHTMDARYQACMRAIKRLAGAVQGLMCDIVVARNAATTARACVSDIDVILSDDEVESIISVSSDFGEEDDGAVGTACRWISSDSEADTDWVAEAALAAAVWPLEPD